MAHWRGCCNLGLVGGKERKNIYCINWRMELKVCAGSSGFELFSELLFGVLNPTLYADRVLWTVNNLEPETRHNKHRRQGFANVRQLPDFVSDHFQVFETLNLSKFRYFLQFQFYPFFTHYSSVTIIYVNRRTQMLKNKKPTRCHLLYLILLLIDSTCFGHYYAQHRELATMLLNYHIGRFVLGLLCVGGWVRFRLE